MFADPGYRTPLAFYEIWRPDRYPVTLYPSPAYCALDAEQVSGELLEAPLMVVSATALAWEPSRSVARDAVSMPGRGRCIVDLDWRHTLWADPDEAPLVLDGVLRLADIVIGSVLEFEAMGLAPDDVAQARDVYLKRGPDGARLIGGGTRIDAAAIGVEVLSRLGSGDAFIAAVGEGTVYGREPAAILRRANAAGAIVATRPTCSDAMPTHAEIDALLEPQAVA